MIVINTNPEGSTPIMIVAKWHADPLGDPAIRDTTYMIGPGQAIDLSILGLEPMRMERGGNEAKAD